MKETVRKFDALEFLMSAASNAQNLNDPHSKWDDNEEREVLSFIEGDLEKTLEYVRTRLNELED